MTALKDLFIFGAGGHAREVAQLVEAINRVTPIYTLRGFVEREASAIGRTVGRYAVVASDEEILRQPGTAVMGFGFPAAIRRVAALAEDAPWLQWPHLVHPSVIWQPDTVVLDRGAVVCASAVLTTDIRLGAFTLVNRSANISHDVQVGDWSVINPGAQVSGDVTIGRGCLVGVGAVILQGRHIGDGAIVGAGAVVTRDVPPGTTVVGVPARARPARM